MNSLDILWIVLAFCALWITAFICWAVYHIAMVARRIHSVLDQGRHALSEIENAIHSVKEKLDHHAKLLDPLIALAGSVIRKTLHKE